MPRGSGSRLWGLGHQDHAARDHTGHGLYRLITTLNQPQYGEAIVLGSITLLIIALIIPCQRWIVGRRHYITVSGSFKPGLIDLGPWKYIAIGAIGGLLVLLTLASFAVIVVGSFMSRVGFFAATPAWTLDHWQAVLMSRVFLKALWTSLILAVTAGVLSPIPLLAAGLHANAHPVARPGDLGLHYLVLRSDPRHTRRLGTARYVPRYAGPLGSTEAFGRSSSW